MVISRDIDQIFITRDLQSGRFWSSKIGDSKIQRAQTFKDLEIVPKKERIWDAESQRDTGIAKDVVQKLSRILREKDNLETRLEYWIVTWYL